MGRKAGVNFNTVPPSPFSSAINAIETTAAISDRHTGALLFYTDGHRIWDVNHNIMQNGTDIGLHGAWQSTVQGAVIVPFIHDENKYYVFTLAGMDEDMGKLFYSVVDMTMNNGLGAVVPDMKKIQIGEGFSEAMIVMQGCEIAWVVTQNVSTGEFYAHKISMDGVDTQPVISSANYPTNLPSAYCLKASPDFKKIATSALFVGVSSSKSYTYLAIHDFDHISGKVTNGRKVDTTNKVRYYNCEFSPNGQYLFSNSGDTIFQYDITLPTHATITASKMAVGNSIKYMTSMQLRSDGNIYVVRYEDQFIGTITNCDARPPACSYTAEAIPIAGNSTYNVPAKIVMPKLFNNITSTVSNATICNNKPLTLNSNKDFGTWQDGSSATTFTTTQPGVYWVRGYDAECQTSTDSFIVDGINVDASLPDDATLCFGDSIVLNIKPNPQGATYLWNDGSTNDTLLIQRGGSYSLTVNYMSCSDRDTMQIGSGHKAIIELGNDTTICNDATMVLPYRADPVEPESYLWHDGSTGKTLNIRGPGKYYVTVSNKCGDISDTITVTGRNCSIFFPSAFSPNGDNLNDRARLLGDIAGVTDYQLSIYNRWGQQVFVTANPSDGWNGMQGASLSDVGVYYYYIRYTYQGQTDIMKGDLILIR